MPPSCTSPCGRLPETLRALGCSQVEVEFSLGETPMWFKPMGLIVSSKLGKLGLKAETWSNKFGYNLDSSYPSIKVEDAQEIRVWSFWKPPTCWLFNLLFHGSHAWSTNFWVVYCSFSVSFWPTPLGMCQTQWKMMGVAQCRCNKFMSSKTHFWGGFLVKREWPMLRVLTMHPPETKCETNSPFILCHSLGFTLQV